MSKTTLPKLPFAGATQTIEELDRTRDGKIDFKGITSNTYDKQGNLIKSVSKADTDFGGNFDGKIDRIVTINNTYNRQGKLTNSVEEINTDGDDTINTKTIVKNTYDRQGNLTSQLKEQDGGDFGGGIIDGKADVRFTTKNTYDPKGRLTSSILQNFFGQIPQTKTTRNTYNQQGNLASSIFEFDDDNDGKIDYNGKIRNTYDKQGRLTRSITETDFGLDGKVDVTDTITNTYDKQGNLTRSVEESDGLGSTRGGNFPRNTTTNTYDKQGNLTRSVIERSGTDGIVKSKDTITGTYSGRDPLCGIGLASDKFDKLTNYCKVMLVGGKGNDLVMGTAKADTLKGGAGKDIFMLATNSGNDTIADFQKGIDVIGLSKGIGFSQLSFNGNKISYQGQDLATLTGIQTSTLTASDFLPI